MNRKTTRENIERIITKIRNKIPDVTLRTSLIDGFPGETEEQFQELYDFVKQAEFNKLGVFEYSKEEGTPAAKLPKQIHHSIKKARHNKIMNLQQNISNKLMMLRVGKIEKVLIENIYTNNGKKFFVCRSSHDAPDIDGVIYIEFNDEELINKFVNCKITNFSEYDLTARLI